MCVNSLPTLSCSNYASFSFLLHIFLSFFRIISLSTLPSNSTLTKAKPECCVPPFLEWKPCHVFVDVHEWTSHTVTECLTVMLHCSHDSEAPHVYGSVLQFFNRRARVIRLLWQCVDSMNDHAWRLILCLIALILHVDLVLKNECDTAAKA